MGTRADFYVGSGPTAEWLGSVAWDGYEWAEHPERSIAAATTEAEYRALVAEELAGRDDATTPDMGWPWPWGDSRTTDYVYFFEDARVKWECFSERRDWPDMTPRRKVTLGRRSGLILAVAGNR